MSGVFLNEQNYINKSDRVIYKLLKKTLFYYCN